MTYGKKLVAGWGVVFLVVSLFLLVWGVKPEKAYALSWTKILDMATSGQPNNDSIFRFQEFNDKLYAGVDQSIEGGTARLFVTSDGTSWSQVSGYTATYSGISTMEVFNGYLYVVEIPNNIYLGGGAITQAMKIQRSADGVTWETVLNNATLGDSSLKYAWNLKSFKGNLYTSVFSYNDTTFQSKGMEVWRTANGTSWEKVAESGFGDQYNLWSIAMESFNDYLYIGTFSFNYTEISNGTEIWRSSTGDLNSWTQANTTGFGSANNFVDYMMVKYKGYLYTGVWSWSEVGDDALKFFKASDGTNWSEVSLSGLNSGDGSGSSNLIMPMIVNDTFWVGNSYTSGGAGMFYSTDVANWQQEGARGFGDAANTDAMAMTLFNQYMYVGFSNSSGAQIWRTGPITPLTVSTESLAAGRLGVPYSASFSISSGTSPYTCSASGDVPPGLTISADCAISGTPAHASSHTFTLSVQDAGIPAQSASKSFTMEIDGGLPETGTPNANRFLFFLDFVLS